MKEIHPKELQKLILQRGCIIVDIRPKAAFEKETLESAISIPADTLDPKSFEKFLQTAESKKIVFMCTRGISSVAAIKNLQREQDFNIYNLKGGLSLSKEENLKTISRKKKGCIFTRIKSFFNES